MTAFGAGAGLAFEAWPSAPDAENATSTRATNKRRRMRGDLRGRESVDIIHRHAAPEMRLGGPVIDWIDARAPERSEHRDHRPRRPRQDHPRGRHAVAIRALPPERVGPRADHGLDRPRDRKSVV